MGGAGRGGERRAARREGIRGAGAQSTVEYAVVLAVFLAVFAACMLFVRAAGDGALARTVEGAASHALSGLGWVDIALY